MADHIDLFSGSGGGVAIDPVAAAANPAHFRQDSSSATTTTTTTPTEVDRLLSDSTGQTSSTGLTGSSRSRGSSVPAPTVNWTTVDTNQNYSGGYLGSGRFPSASRLTFEIGGNSASGEIHYASSGGGAADVHSGLTVGAGVKSVDPRHHVYSTVKESVKVELRGSLPQAPGAMSNQPQSLSQLYQHGQLDHEVTTSVHCV